MSNGMVRGRKGPDWRKVGFGVGIGALSMIVMAALTAWMVGNEVIRIAWMDELSAAILLVCSFLGGKISRTDEDDWVGPAVAGLLCWILLLTMLVVIGGSMGGVLPVGFALAGGVGSSMLLNGKNGGKRRRRKRGYR